MRATDFEFRHRYFLIMAIYAVGFSCYWIDHRNAAQALLSLIGQDNNMLAIRAWITFTIVALALIWDVFAQVRLRRKRVRGGDGVIGGRWPPAMRRGEQMARGPRGNRVWLRLPSNPAGPPRSDRCQARVELR